MYNAIIRRVFLFLFRAEALEKNVFKWVMEKTYFSSHHNLRILFMLLANLLAQCGIFAYAFAFCILDQWSSLVYLHVWHLSPFIFFIFCIKIKIIYLESCQDQWRHLVSFICAFPGVPCGICVHSLDPLDLHPVIQSRDHLF